MIDLKRGPFAPLPEGDEIVLGLDAQGGAGYLWRDAYRTHLGRPPAYDAKRLNLVGIRQPGERGAPRVSFSTCVNDGRVALETVGALGLAVTGPLLWTAYRREQAPRGMFSTLVDITNGWRFPTPSRRLLPVPKLGELLVAADDAGGAFYSFINDAGGVVAVVLRHDGQELRAAVTTLPVGPFVRWELTDHAREVGFDSQHVRFSRVMGAEAERAAAYLVEVADRGLFTMPGCGLRRRRKM